MTRFSFFRRPREVRSADSAKDRLQILLAHERAAVSGKPDLVALLREEILAVIAKHVTVDPNRVRVTMERGESVSTLEVDVEIPVAMAA